MALGITSGEAAQDDKIGRAGAERRVGALPGLLMLVLRLRACCVQVLFARVQAACRVCARAQR